MELRQLGKSPVKVSPIIFGAWAIGGWMWGGSDEQSAIDAIQSGLDEGVNTIDTAPIYGMGYSEELVAKAIQGKRDRVVLATKCGLRWTGEEGTNPWPQKDNQGKDVIIRNHLKPKSIFEECEQSLKRLKTDVIDLYQIHWPDLGTPIEESWNAMVKLKEQGKVRAIGVSNYTLEQLAEAHQIHPVDSVQPPYSIIRRGIEKDLLPFCQKHQIGVIVYSPLERGLLTGKVTVDRIFPKGDHRRESALFSLENRQKVLDALDEISSVAHSHDATLSQLIINWTINVPGITAAIVGSRNADQAIENARAAKLDLFSTEYTKINQAFIGIEQTID